MRVTSTYVRRYMYVHTSLKTIHVHTLTCGIIRGHISFVWMYSFLDAFTIMCMYIEIESVGNASFVCPIYFEPLLRKYLPEHNWYVLCTTILIKNISQHHINHLRCSVYIISRKFCLSVTPLINSAMVVSVGIIVSRSSCSSRHNY